MLITLMVNICYIAAEKMCLNATKIKRVSNYYFDILSYILK